MDCRWAVALSGMRHSSYLGELTQVSRLTRPQVRHPLNHQPCAYEDGAEEVTEIEHVVVHTHKGDTHRGDRSCLVIHAGG
jgi:hypothetical protein